MYRHEYGSALRVEEALHGKRHESVETGRLLVTAIWTVRRPMGYVDPKDLVPTDIPRSIESVQKVSLDRVYRNEV